MSHLLEVIHQKQTALTYAQQNLLQILEKGTNAERILALENYNTIRTELKAYKRLQALVSPQNPF